MKKNTVMVPIKFKEANLKFEKPKDMTDDECKDLWVYMELNTFVSCWKLSFTQRLKALLFGKVWLCVRGKNHPPVWLDCRKTVFRKDNK